MSRRFAYIEESTCDVIIRDPGATAFGCAAGGVSVAPGNTEPITPAGTSLLAVALAGFGTNDHVVAHNRITGAVALNNPIYAAPDELHGCDVDPSIAPSQVYTTRLAAGNNSFLERVVIDKSSGAETSLVNVTNGQGATVTYISVDSVQQIVWIAKTAHLVRVPIGPPWVQASLRTDLGLGNHYDNNLVLAPDEEGARLFYGREEDDVLTGPTIFRINSSSPFGDTQIISRANIDLIPGITIGSELRGLVYVPKSLSGLGKNFLYVLNEGGDCFRLDESGGTASVIVQEGSWDDLGIGSQNRSGFWSCIRYHQQENNLWLLTGRAASVKRIFTMDFDGSNQAIRISRVEAGTTFRGFGFGSEIVS